MMMYNGVHSIDRLAWLAGSPIVRATGLSGTFSYPVDLEDNLVGCVAFRGGGLGAVIQHKSTATRTLGGWQTMIWGTRGAIKVLTGGGLEIASEKEQVSMTVEDDDRFLGGLIEFTSAIAAGRRRAPMAGRGARPWRPSSACTRLPELDEPSRSRRPRHDHRRAAPTHSRVHDPDVRRQR